MAKDRRSCRGCYHSVYGPRTQQDQPCTKVPKTREDDLLVFLRTRQIIVNVCGCKHLNSGGQSNTRTVQKGMPPKGKNGLAIPMQSMHVIDLHWGLARIRVFGGEDQHLAINSCNCSRMVSATSCCVSGRRREQFFSKARSASTYEDLSSAIELANQSRFA
jgi:hypothetical protein